MMCVFGAAVGVGRGVSLLCHSPDPISRRRRRQASISWDVLLSSAACVTFVVASGGTGGSSDPDRRPSGLPFALAVPLVSPAATFAAFLAAASVKRITAGRGEQRDGRPKDD